MQQALEQMLRAYEPQTSTDKKNAIKEIIQEIVLCGLSRAGFFKHAAFYGGTALRIFYGLDRFSEDLDFSLMVPEGFDLGEYLPALEKEIRSYGLNFKAEERVKTAESAIQSAFLKGNTKEHILLFYADDRLAQSITPGELIKIKFEIDTNPPPYASFEHKYRLLPSPYEISLYDAPSLFAGKIHAVLCRAWKNRIKGRDLYDYVFYLSMNTPVNLKHLEARLRQSDYLETNAPLDIGQLKELLHTRFATIDYEQAKQDVLPFIKDPNKLSVWGQDFFSQITENLTRE